MDEQYNINVSIYFLLMFDYLVIEKTFIIKILNSKNLKYINKYILNKVPINARMEFCHVGIQATNFFERAAAMLTLIIRMVNFHMNPSHMSY